LDRSEDVGVEVNIQVIKITNPVFLGRLGPQIKVFFDKLKIKGMTYESLYTYFANTIQFGGNAAEFWVVFENEDPVGFAHWFVRGLPHISKVYCDFIKKKKKNRDAHLTLLKEFVNFGKRHRAVWYEGDATSEAVFRLFRKRTKELGYEVAPSGYINFIGRKMEKKDEDIRKDST